MRVEGSRAELTEHDSIPHISVKSMQRALRWHPRGLDSWSPADWAVALAGEVGELCNVVKKLNRVRDKIGGNKESEQQLFQMLRDEVADVYLYLDLFATRMHIDLGLAVRDKFNNVSERMGFPERLE